MSLPVQELLHPERATSTLEDPIEELSRFVYSRTGLADEFESPRYREIKLTAIKNAEKLGIPPLLFSQGLYALEDVGSLQSAAKEGRKVVSPKISGCDFVGKPEMQIVKSPTLLAQIRALTGCKEGDELSYGSYGNALGFASLREQWANFANLILKIPQIAPTNVLVLGGGSAGGIALITRYIFSNGPGSIAMFNPRFPGYISPLRTYMKGIVNGVVLIPSGHTADGQPDLNEVERVLQMHFPKILYVSDPDNPGGGILTNESLAGLIKLGQKNNCHIHFEWPYATMIFEGKFTGIPKELTGFPKGVSASASVSKMFLRSGLRGAALFGDTKLIGELARWVNDLEICSSYAVQGETFGLLKSNSRTYFESLKNEVAQRRLIAAKAFEENGFKVKLPQATGYMHIDSSAKYPQLTAVDVAETLAEFGMAVAPGDADFGMDPQTCRVSIVRPLKELHAIGERLQLAAQALREKNLERASMKDLMIM